MISPKLISEISDLISKYFVENTKLPIRESNSIYIRSVLNQRIDEYFPKSGLNKILIEKGFKYRIDNKTDYYFNISQKDLRTLLNSKSILRIIAKNNNYTFSELVKLHRFRNVDFYKYTFKYLIKCNFKSAFIEKTFTELDIYNVLARELGINNLIVKNYIETFNSPKFPDIPEDILEKLMNLFKRERKEILTDENYNR